MSITAHHEFGCRTCGSDIPKRYRAYCSGPCREAWYENHRWPEARDAAYRRNREAGGPACELCGDTNPTNPSNYLWHQWEVDHITPINGWDRGQMTCMNHQDNLRLLCVPCHRRVTRLAARGDGAE